MIHMMGVASNVSKHIDIERMHAFDRFENVKLNVIRLAVRCVGRTRADAGQHLELQVPVLLSADLKVSKAQIHKALRAFSFYGALDGSHAIL